MKPYKAGVFFRFLMAAAAAFATQAAPGKARAQAGSFGDPDGVVHPAVGIAGARAAGTVTVGNAARPTITLSHTWEDTPGSPNEEFVLDIEFSEVVTGFKLTDIAFQNADPVSPLVGTGASYTTTVETDVGFEGTVHIRIAANVAENTDDEGNLGTGYSFHADNRAPEAIAAEVEGDRLTVDFNEALDASFTPSGSDFTVRVTDPNAARSIERVSRVLVAGDRLILTLADSVEADDEVEVAFRNLGFVRLQDAFGNYAEGFGYALEVTNLTEGGTETPGPPRRLEADADGFTEIDLDWRAPLDEGDDEVTGYRIEVSANDGDTWSALVRDTDDTRTAYTHTGLSAGTTRHYRVAAINSFGEGAYSNVAHATTEERRVPDAPTRLTAAASGTSSIVLDWRAPASGSGGPITGYRIEVSRTGTGGWTVLDAHTNSSATTYTHSGLNPGSTRYYRVSAINRSGRGDPSEVDSATTDVTAPGAPTGLRAVPSGLGGSSQLLLTWARPSSNGGSAITGYRIEVSSSGATGWTVLLATTGSAATTYLHSGLPPATARFYRVAAVNSEGAGAYSNVARGATSAARPGQPRSLRARADGPRSITITWQAPSSDSGARITGYSIRARGPRDSGWITIRPNTGSTATTFTHTNLQPVTAYRYQVAAINSVGAGAWSVEAGTSTHADVPSAPFELAARSIGTSQIDLSWKAPRNNNGAPVFGYRIEASSDGGRTWRIIRSNTGSTATRYSHRGLQPASTRHYRVYGINAAGLGAASNVARATTEATVPGAPANLTAAADGTSEIDLTWQEPPTDGGAQVTGYRVEVSDDGGGIWQNLVANTRSARTSYSHTGLAPATTRHYRVSAINRIGIGRASRVASATTDATVPDAPTGLTATATAPTQIDLAWAAPAYDGGAAVSGYRIEVSENGANWVDLRRDTESTSTSFSHTGLLPGSRRFYRVSAINVAGTGEPSGVASAATDDPVERAGRLNTMVLPHVAGAMVSSTVSAIADRIDAVANGMGMQRRMEMGGLSSMAASLASPGAPGLGGRHDRSGLSTLFGGTSFQMPLGASDAPQEAGSPNQMATWGAGEYHHLGEPGAADLDWTGNMISAHVGADTRVTPYILAGIAASHSAGDFDFTDKTGASPVEGTYGTTMTSVNPYVAWFQGERGNAAWGTAGFGWGDVEVKDEREDLRTTPARMMTGAAGGSYQLLERGTGGVRVKAEGWAGRVMVDGSERIDSVTLDMQRAKLALEWTQGFRSSAGNEVAIVLEGGGRYDNGDGINGASAEVGGGLRYSNAQLGLVAEGRGRIVISARDGYEEWGFGGMLQLDPGVRGRGLSIRLAPAYGDAASGVNQLWERGVSGAVRDHDFGAATHLDAEVAYGLAGFHGTPYGGFHLSESGARAFSSGLRYDLGSGLGLRIEGTRREGALGGAEHSVGIRGRLRFGGEE